MKITSLQNYQDEIKESQKNPDQFWEKIAQNYHWFKKWNKVSNCNLDEAKISWFEGGKTNISYNCLDRHLAQNANKTAIIFEPNNPNDAVQKVTYQELHDKVCAFANLLKGQGVKKGDRVVIYMPMIVEGVVAMLACARIGAIHSVVFAGFSAKALASRIKDSGAKIVITSDLLFRGDKILKLFDIVNEAINESGGVEKIITYQKDEKFTGNEKTIIWQEEIKKYSSENEAEILDAEDGLFTLYTSGSTGTPKGIYHTIGGYMTYAGYSFANVFDYQKDEIFFCSADIGWITGHSYLTYGPLLNGATILMFEGVPTFPDASRFWCIIEKHRVNIFYTAPTAIRALMQKGDEFVDGHDLSSLRILGTVGEPINEEAWQWYFEKIGGGKCKIVDTWWQTETGGIMISSLPAAFDSIPAHAGLGLPGVFPILLDEDGKEISKNNQNGFLCFKQPWPSMARGVWNNEAKFIDTYYSKFKGYYLAGDSAFRSDEGFYRIIGRIDDVINVSGHRLGTAEIENAINSCPQISESAVIGSPHPIKGEAIYAFVILNSSNKPSSLDSSQSEDLMSQNSQTKKEIVKIIEKEIGAIARPEKIIITPDLPKTRSGKIMRRILKQLVAKSDDFGDISTLVNPDIINNMQKLI